MMKRGLCGLLIAVMVLAVVPAAFAQEAVEIEGVIKSIDLEASTVTIEESSTEEEPAPAVEVTLTITEDTQIIKAGETTTIENLAVGGGTGFVTYDPATTMIISIEVMAVENALAQEEQPEVPKEKTSRFEAIVALIAIALAGAGVALKRKKK
jgi:hypothetical protein